MKNNNFYLRTMTEEELIIGMMEEVIEEQEQMIARLEAQGVDMKESKDLLIAREIALKNFQEK